MEAKITRRIGHVGLYVGLYLFVKFVVPSHFQEYEAILLVVVFLFVACDFLRICVTRNRRDDTAISEFFRKDKGE